MHRRRRKYHHAASARQSWSPDADRCLAVIVRTKTSSRVEQPGSFFCVPVIIPGLSYPSRLVSSATVNLIRTRTDPGSVQRGRQCKESSRLLHIRWRGHQCPKLWFGWQTEPSVPSLEDGSVAQGGARRFLLQREVTRSCIRCHLRECFGS